MSKNVSSTCALVTPRARSSSSYTRYNLPCPTALAACSSPMALGRWGSPIARIPRAIAPLVTRSASSPRPCSSAAASHTRASASSRSSPSESATTDEPSLITTRFIVQSLRGHTRIQLEDDSGDAHLIARDKPLSLECVKHPDATQAFLHIGEGVLVVDVVAAQQSLNPAPVDRERARTEPLHRVAAPTASSTGPEDHVLSQLLLNRARGNGGNSICVAVRCGGRVGHDPQQQLPQLAHACARGAG